VHNLVGRYCQKFNERIMKKQNGEIQNYEEGLPEFSGNGKER